MVTLYSLANGMNIMTNSLCTNNFKEAKSLHTNDVHVDLYLIKQRF